MRKILFIDRDGTIIKEPSDFQVDSLEKLELVEGVIPALLKLKAQGFRFVMVSNQDGLGTDSFPVENFIKPQEKLLRTLSGQGIDFDEILICPHLASEQCECRKPRLGLVVDYLRDPTIDFDNSYVIGDRESDIKLAENMKIRSFQVREEMTADCGLTWADIVSKIGSKNRTSTVERSTSETRVTVSVDLDDTSKSNIQTGISFFDHMLEQIAKHGQLSLNIKTTGDLEVDDHHTVEDTALALGSALNKALSDRYAIERYGFTLPMDESAASVLMDLGGRPYFKFEGSFERGMVGNLSTEMVPHFFKSISETLKANIHIKVEGENCHHKIECIFKAFAKTFAQAKTINIGSGLPSTKGLL